VAALAAIAAVDSVLSRNGDLPLVPFGLLDETGHLATAVLLLAVLPTAWLTGPFAAGALAASVLIDFDHLPQELGSYAITEGTLRPYPHSLLSPLVVLAAALLARGRARVVLLGAVAGLASHLLRDAATGGGLPLLWPVSIRDATMPYAVYGAAVAGLAVLALAGRRRPVGGSGLRRRRRPDAAPGARRPSGPPAAT
jgi:inner membrane protein